MKKFFVTLAMMMLVATQVFAMSNSRIRETARFLSDRMAWELDMTPQQYDDCYEINYDFIFAINPIMDDVSRGYLSAIDMYYTYLDWRNDDLRFVLNAVQYRRFLELEYFYRPVYTYRGRWLFRVYQIYNNPKFYYFNAPSVFKIYAGGHSRTHFSDGFYHRDHRYGHSIDPNPHHIHGAPNMNQHQRLDFGNNHREPGAHSPMNGYNNRNQDNREKDSRYKDQRKGQNKNTPQINQRGNAPASGHQGSTRSGASNGNPSGSSQSGVISGGAGHSRSGRR